MFRFVKFKMFETQVNGEDVPTCKCMVEGVLYKDLNTAKKINAGIDIIQAISMITETNLPLFVDNKESVSVIEGIDTLNIGQIVLLEKVKGMPFQVVT